MATTKKSPGIVSPERVRQYSQEGAAGGKPEEELEGHEMYDVRPSTVGLVQRGANRKSFFLAKSEEGDPMASDTNAATGGVQVAEDLDTLVTRLENAANDGMGDDWEDEEGNGEESTDPNEAPKKKKTPNMPFMQALLKDISDSIGVLAGRRTRDPLGAAQRALGNLGGHPEFNDIAQRLVEYINTHGGKVEDPKSSPDATPKPKPAPAAPDAQPGDAPTGTFSISEKAADSAGNESPAPAQEGDDMGNGITAAELQAAITAALEPFAKRLDAVEGGQSTLQKAIEENKEKKEEQELSLLAKSAGVTPATMLAMKRNMDPTEFVRFSQTSMRNHRLLQKSGLFGEIGTGSGGEAEMMDPEVLIEKKARELVDADKTHKLTFSDAVIQAAETLNLDLNPAPRFGAEV